MDPDTHIVITTAVTPEDVFAIASLYPSKSATEQAEMVSRSLQPESVALQQGKRTILLAKQETNVMGTVQVVWENDDEDPVLQAPRTAVVHHLRTHPGYEGRGIATRLMEEAEMLARQRGLAQLTLGVEPGNARALRLYRKWGYEEFRRYQGTQGEPIIGMRKRLPRT